MDIHTHAYVKLLLSPRQSRGISYWINQGAAIMAWTGISWGHVLLNFLVPYCVASYSAAKIELGKRDKHDA